MTATIRAVLSWALVLSAAAALAGKPPRPERASASSERGKAITMDGEIACLPSTGHGVQTMACEIGFKGPEGLYYRLRNLKQRDLINGRIVTGRRYRITGRLVIEESRNHQAGVLIIQSYKALSSD